jgi:hypothetical protein
MAEILKEEANVSMEERIQHVSLKNVFYWLALAWTNISENLIRNSWKQIVTSDFFETVADGTSNIVQDMLNFNDVSSLHEQSARESSDLNSFASRLTQNFPGIIVSPTDFEEFYLNCPQIYGEEIDGNYDEEYADSSGESDIEFPSEKDNISNEITPDQAIEMSEKLISFMQNKFSPAELINAHRLRENILVYKIKSTK